MTSVRVRRALPIGIFLVCLVVFSLSAHRFLAFTNLLNILQVVSFVSVPALGLAIVMLSGKFDLSFVGVIGISAVLAAHFTNNGMSPALALAITLVVAVALELVNALFIVKLKIHPWLTTIATMLVYLGLEKAISGGHYLTAESSFFSALRFGTLVGIPSAVWIMVAVWLAVAALMQLTRVGTYLYAVGGSEEATTKAGISSDFYRTIAFVLMGVLSWVSSILYVAQLSGYPAEAAYINQLEVILAVFFGMALSRRGIINVNGAFLGAAFVAFLANGLGLLGVSSYWIKLAEGVLVVLVIIGNSVGQGRLVRLE